MKSAGQRFVRFSFGDWHQAGTNREQLFWALQLTGWLGASALAVFPLMQIFSVKTALIILGVRMATGILITCGLRAGYRRLAWRQWSWWRLLALVVSVSIVLGVIDAMLTPRLAASLIEEHVPVPVRAFLDLMGALLRSCLLLIWSLLYFGIKLWIEAAAVRLRAAQSEAAARTSELRQLRAQVNPHFLFNALNSVLAEKDNPQAVERITQELAEYLRFSLRPSGDFQTLGEELDALEHYLRVEKARFEEKLTYTIDADAAVRAVRVPVATVQPLLENAMKYGRLTSPGVLDLKIAARVDPGAGVLRLAVENTGRWLQFDPARSHGIGVSNLRRRLELLFGVSASLAHEERDGRVHARVEIPLSPAIHWSATS